jgi:enoyl-CoA hydratase/carnithine racemase
VNEVVAHDELLSRTIEIARDICAANQEVLAEMKGLIEFRNQASLKEALAEERRSIQEFIRRALQAIKSGSS